jgi:hypothetical protein
MSGQLFAAATGSPSSGLRRFGKPTGNANGNSMTKVQVIYWRDIPAQIKAQAGSKRASRALSKRFSVAIDEAAMRAELTGSNDYLAQWHASEWAECEGELEEAANALVNEIEAAYPPQRLMTLIQQFGLE